MLRYQDIEEDFANPLSGDSETTSKPIMYTYDKLGGTIESE